MVAGLLPILSREHVATWVGPWDLYALISQAAHFTGDGTWHWSLTQQNDKVYWSSPLEVLSDSHQEVS